MNVCTEPSKFVVHEQDEERVRQRRGESFLQLVARDITVFQRRQASLISFMCLLVQAQQNPNKSPLWDPLQLASSGVFSHMILSSKIFLYFLPTFSLCLPHPVTSLLCTSTIRSISSLTGYECSNPLLLIMDQQTCNKEEKTNMNKITDKKGLFLRNVSAKTRTKWKKRKARTVLPPVLLFLFTFWVLVSTGFSDDQN